MQNLSVKTTKNNTKSAIKIWGALALVALFVCGLIVGVTLRSGYEKPQLSQTQCRKLQDKIEYTIIYNEIEKTKDLVVIYEKSCVSPVPDVNADVKKEENEENKEQTECEKIENLLLARLGDYDQQNYSIHEYNTQIYEKLMEVGCPQNKGKYSDLARVESGVAQTLREIDGAYYFADVVPCEIIEANLQKGLYLCERDCDYNVYLKNAKIYSKLYEEGCPENSEKYKNLALAQLQIASALMNETDVAENSNMVVDTYKKLQMEQKANEYLDKIRKLVGPASDFILTIGKVINE